MRYAVQAIMFLPVPKLLAQRPFLRMMWKLARVPIAAVCYSGAVVSPLPLEIMPFGVLEWLGLYPPSIWYWLVALATLAGSLALCLLCAVGVYRGLRERCVNMDAIAVGVGSVIGALFLVLILPRGLPRSQ